MPINKLWLAKPAGLGLLILLLLAVAVIALGPVYERWRAGQLLALLQQTKVGKTTLPEFRSVADKKLRFTCLNFGKDENSASYVVFDQSVTNPVGIHGFAPWSIFTVQVVFDKGIVISKSAHFASGEHAEFSGTVNEWLHKPVLLVGISENSPPPPHHWAGFEYNPWHRFYIDDDIGATEAEKQADWHINLGCMTRFGGCHDARELFPDVRPTPPLSDSPDIP